MTHRFRRLSAVAGIATLTIVVTACVASRESSSTATSITDPHPRD